MTAELLTVDAATYHADLVADGPTLSASIAHEIISRSPAHAFAKHPRLNPDVKQEAKKSFDLGTAVHEVLLEGVDNVTVIAGFTDWKKKDAQDQRDEARSYGRIPMLAHEHERVLAMCEAVRTQLAERNLEQPFFEGGLPEATITWDEGDGVVCRSRMDWLHNDYLLIDDLKTSGQAVDSRGFGRTAFNLGYDLKAAFYLRGAQAAFDTDATFRWLAVEATPPFALNIFEPDADTLAVGAAKVERAIEIWRDCLATGIWPAYTRETVTVSPPAWEMRWVTDAIEDEAWEAFAA